MELSGNKILITGATSGIGKAILEGFLKEDNEIIAVGRNIKILEELSSIDKRIHTFQCDLSQKEGVEELILWIEQKHKDLNILINNAGIQYNYHFLDEKQLTAKINHEVQVNLIAPLQLINYLLPILESNSKSAIINISSGIAIVPKMTAPVYCATKSAIHTFSKSLRYQLEGKIKVFEVIPPLVDTQMTKGRGKGKITPEQLTKEFLKKYKKDKYEISIGKVKL